MGQLARHPGKGRRRLDHQPAHRFGKIARMAPDHHPGVVLVGDLLSPDGDARPAWRKADLEILPENLLRETVVAPENPHPLVGR